MISAMKLASMFWLLALSLSGAVQAQLLAYCTITPSVLTKNSLGQDTCFVYYELLTQCVGATVTLYPLTAGLTYNGPSVAKGIDPSACTCSSVNYMLASACGYCQNQAWVTFAEFTSNCAASEITIGYPDPVPEAVVVPAWATVSIPTSYNFDPTAALEVGGASGSIGSSPTTAFTTTQPLPTTNYGSPGASKSNVGAAVGGGVGGGVGLIAIVSGLIYWWRKKRSQPPSSGVYPQAPPQPMHQTYTTHPAYTPVPQTSPDMCPKVEIPNDYEPTTL
ncbi:hypothetical protein JAAARDRAFT_399693 [Jaapia argillacea MUCL 33604]|uniref:Uncharacterized protein n=1 Tax=Jaapia argillacea MUCL 33604 TaxID=933084 RepID=A0A067PLA1_9AGAM|nr:hypothetical protein JAAARDRAFT_399693 [Jaapia argillacea MUCL 33604]